RDGVGLAAVIDGCQIEHAEARGVRAHAAQDDERTERDARGEDQPPRHRPTALRIASPNAPTSASPSGNGSLSSHSSDTDADPMPSTSCLAPTRTTTSLSRGPSGICRSTWQSRPPPMPPKPRLRRAMNHNAIQSATTMPPISRNSEVKPSSPPVIAASAPHRSFDDQILEIDVVDQHAGLAAEFVDLLRAERHQQNLVRSRGHGGAQLVDAVLGLQLVDFEA